MKLKLTKRVFEKYINIKFHKNPSSGSPDVLCRQKDKRDEANSGFFQVTNLMHTSFIL